LYQYESNTVIRNEKFNIMLAIKSCFKLDHINDKYFGKEMKIHSVQINKSDIKFFKPFRYNGKKD